MQKHLNYLYKTEFILTMRVFFQSVILIGLVSACGSGEQPTTVTNSDTTGLTQPNLSLTNPDDELMQTDSLFEQNIAAFPKHWVEIAIKGKEQIYTEYCGMGHPYWKLVKTDSSWQIETFYGHDGEFWDVMNMTANIQSAEGQVFQEGIFVVTKATYPDNEIYEVSYFWNQTVGFCTFGDFFDKTKKFADYAGYDSFTIRKEACDL